MDSLLLNFEEVALLIGFKTATIENWAYRRKPAPQGFPRRVKVGRILRYRRVDIENWVAALGEQEETTSEVSPGHSNKRRGKPSNSEASAAEAMGLTVPAWRKTIRQNEEL